MVSREGDLLQTRHEWIFDVKGIVHPPDRIIAFPRFIPDPHGTRKRKNSAYRKVYALAERYKLLEAQIPHYLVYDEIFDERLCEVLKKDITRYYDPVKRLQELRGADRIDRLEQKALDFMESLQTQSGVPWNKLGISGSLLTHLHTPTSDIDPMVYGKQESIKISVALKRMMENTRTAVKAYAKEELRSLFDFRSQDTQMSFEDFIVVEQRKTLQGKFMQHDFYIRCVKDWNEAEESYGDTIYEKVGYAKVKATVFDASEAMFTPCRYPVDNVKLLGGAYGEMVTEIASFRGRFCEQAREGETVIAQGKVEKVRKKQEATFFRLLLGSEPSDFMVLER